MAEATASRLAVASGRGRSRRVAFARSCAWTGMAFGPTWPGRASDSSALDAQRFLGEREATYGEAVAILDDDAREAWRRHAERFDGDGEDVGRSARQGEDARRASEFATWLSRDLIAELTKRKVLLEHRDLIRRYAFGNAFDPARLERLARYEVSLDRKLERMLSMLIKLQAIRRD